MTKNNLVYTLDMTNFNRLSTDKNRVRKCTIHKISNNNVIGKNFDRND